MELDEQTQTELESAAFRRLVEHLRERTDVQNIDIMDLAGFCRNCLSRWYQEAAEARGIQLDKAEAREIIYGMPYAEWKKKYQTDAGTDPGDKTQLREALDGLQQELEEFESAHPRLAETLAKVSEALANLGI